MNTSSLVSCLSGTQPVISALFVLIGFLCALIIVMLVFMSYMRLSLMRLNYTSRIASKTLGTTQQM